MQKIMLICHANICRSPMAEFILREAARQRGMDGSLMISSCGTSAKAVGQPMHPSVAQTLQKYGIPYSQTTARQLQKGDYDQFDYFLAMDKWDLSSALRIFGSDPAHKLHLFMEWSDVPRDIIDPAYAHRFDVAFENIAEGAEALLDKLAES